MHTTMLRLVDKPKAWSRERQTEEFELMLLGGVAKIPRLTAHLPEFSFCSMRAVARARQAVSHCLTLYRFFVLGMYSEYSVIQADVTALLHHPGSETKLDAMLAFPTTSIHIVSTQNGLRQPCWFPAAGNFSKSPFVNSCVPYRAVPSLAVLARAKLVAALDKLGSPSA